MPQRRVKGSAVMLDVGEVSWFLSVCKEHAIFYI
jgi:hypothetical protein